MRGEGWIHGQQERAAGPGGWKKDSPQGVAGAPRLMEQDGVGGADMTQVA